MITKSLHFGSTGFIRAGYTEAMNADQSANRRGRLCLASLFLVILACRFSPGVAPTPTVAVLADTFFSGYAFLDANGNGQLDERDPPLAGARFSAAGFGGRTDAKGYAFIVIPGGWDQPVNARMAPPPGSAYTLVGPQEVVLQNSGPTSARFLFTAPLPSATASPTLTAAPRPTLTATVMPSPIPSLTPARRPQSQAGKMQRDVTYCTVGTTALKMDLYYPEEQAAPAPVVVYVHGGGWTAGDKSDGVGPIFFPELQRRGYLVASINYRLAPTYKFPAQIEDVKCAVRSLRAGAATYNLDPERIGAMGASAGGHLVALLGTTTQEAGWDVGEHPEQSSRVQAVVDMFGPTDLTLVGDRGQVAIGEQVFGLTSFDQATLEAYSPVTYVTSDDPPFLLLHGDKDQLVSLEHSRLLQARLQAAGVPAELIVVKNAGHAFRPVGGTLDPDPLQLMALTADFLDQYLKP